MSQKTNLNINPYYDDFNESNNFHRVLFRPGRPVQARELTTLQSILQNQVKEFGSHTFKEGSLVIPGNVKYDNKHFSVKLESDHLGIPVSLYADQLKGTKLKGQNSGIEILVNDYKTPLDSSDITDLTLFIKYVSSDDNNVESSLTNGEPLLAQEVITYGNTTIDVGESVANLISSNATFTGSSVSIEDGVYFIRGNFVNVSADTIILDPYSNTPSYRVGLNVLESIITAKEDTSLYDNARGFSNYAAPGADRLKITTTLAKKSLTDFNDSSFIEIVKLRDGELKKLQDSSNYNIIAKYFAQRTYEESGNYSIDNFNVRVSESLNDNISNDGIFQSDQVTDQGNTPSDELGCVEIEAGKAYVKGHRVERVGTTIVDFDKPRDTETIKSAKVPFEMGSLIRVNNVFGTPLFGLNNNSNTVGLYDERKSASNATTSTGDEIGVARVYSLGLRNTPYSATEGAGSEWNLYLYDIQTYTKLTLNLALAAHDCPVSTFVRGVSSGASGYVKSVNGSDVTISQTSGTFITGEKILINETDEHSRSISSFVTYGVDDIKSVYQNSSAFAGLNVNFTADTVLKEVSIFSSGTTIEVVTTSPMSGTIESFGNTFNKVKAKSIVKYQAKDFEKFSTSPNFNKVDSISPDLKTLNVLGVSTAIGVCTGFVGVATGSAISVMVPEIVNDQSAGLYAPVGPFNLAELNLSDSELVVSEQIKSQTVSGGKLTAVTGLSSAFFTSFDTQRYSVFYGNGTIAPLTKDQFTRSSDASTIVIEGLTNGNNVTINATTEKQVVKEKIKEYTRSNQLIVNKTSAGVSTTTSGLSTSRYYGLRVEDSEISLNVPDVCNIVTIVESKDETDPTLDKLTFISGLSLDTNVVVGEKIKGSESGSIAQVVSVVSSTEITIGYLNSNKFNLGELITFEESNIVTTLQGISIGNGLDISSTYSLDKGQREQYYDYSRLVRRSNFPKPSKKILVVYNSYKVPSSDEGDVFTVNSYNKDRYSNDIPILDSGIRATDTLDFRPRVSEFTSTDKSPFAFTSRNFSGNGATSTLIVSSEGDSEVGYSYYLPRIDKLILTTEEDSSGDVGKFSLIQGVPSLSPKEPVLIDDAMHVASIHLPAYLYHASDAKVTLVDNKRYTMRDIGRLDDRISNLETVTSLSLLELDTKSLQVRDASGNDRFKTGFFVDDFRDDSRIDVDNPDNKVDIDPNVQQMLVPMDKYTFFPDYAPAESEDITTCDFSQNLPLLDENVQKTGELITLKYDEVKSDIGNAFASHFENVNPFLVVKYEVDIKLEPRSDNWVRTEYIKIGERTENGDTNRTEYELGDIIGARKDEHIRSRNVSFSAVGLKPKTRYYPFFDGRSGIDIIPKLIEISMQSGSFQINETVIGYPPTIENNPAPPLIRFRVAQPNHKTGAYDDPRAVFVDSPYDDTLTVSASYTESSSILNVDLASLCKDAQGDYFGRMVPGMRFVGQSSNAIAVHAPKPGFEDSIRLISDSFGSLYGSFFFRDPLTDPPPQPRFNTGTKTFRITSSKNNETIVDTLSDTSVDITAGEAIYPTEGVVMMQNRTTINIQVPPPKPPHDDPLAQSFTTDSKGMFLSSVDLYFAEKDPNQAITVEIVTVELGTPTNQVIQGFAQIQVNPQETVDSAGNIVPSIIQTSTDASVATNVKFPSPVWLEPNTEYALRLRAASSEKYKVWCARMGEPTIETKNLDAGAQTIISSQYIGGSLFKSQNGTIWTPSQFEDLKFSLYQCSFVNSGTLTLYNPSLNSNNPNFKTPNNAIELFPRKLKVGITTTANTNILADLVPGTKISSALTGSPTISIGATGFLEQSGGPLLVNTAGRTITSGGSGYSFTGTPTVDLVSITGNGSGATAVLGISGGVINAVSIANTGSGYVAGDVVGVKTSSLPTGKKTGEGAQITVSDIWGIDTLYLSDVQGESYPSENVLVYTKANGTTITPQVGTALTTIQSSSVLGELYQGNVIKVQQFNHGMTADNNIVVLDNIQPDTIPVTLNTDLGSTSTTISVANTATFSTFEGISTSTGYVKIGNEIIFYDGIGAGSLSVSQRGFGGSPQDSHLSGSSVYKYEFNGISLTGINTEHNMADNSVALNALKTIDTYYVSAARGAGRPNLQDRSTGQNQLSFTRSAFGGGNHIISTQNFQYDTFIPSFNVMTPTTESTIDAQLRSVSGTSDGGTEPSFIDQGYESVEFNQLNRLSSPRLLCSRVDEIARLSNFPKNKSVTLSVNFQTTDSNVSPVLDLDNGSFKLWRNRLNNPVVDYANDSRSNALTGDPHAACYISQKVNLAQESNSLKVLIGAYRHPSADFRVLYRLFKADSSEVQESYKLFPGYDNLDDQGVVKNVIDPDLNSGRPDVFIPASLENQFKDYEFTINDEDNFTGFQIKIVISGTNEAKPPRFKDLRVIALAK